MANFELNVKINGIEQTVSTIGGLEQALAATNAQLSQVEQNSRDFGFLTNQASNLETVLNALTTDAQSFSTNLNSVNQAATQLGTTITETANASSELGKSRGAEKLTKSIQETSTQSTSLKAELRKITLELQNLEPGSQRFQELTIRAGELKDQIGDTNAVVSALAGSTAERLGRALQSTVSIGIAGFQGIEGAAALFGVEAEALEPTMVRLQALLNLSQAIETFGTFGDKLTEITAGFKSLTGATEASNVATNASVSATNADTIATEASAIANSANATANKADAAASLQDAAAKGVETVATEGATVATTALSLAMKSLPIIAIAAALGTLVYGIYQYVSATGNAKKNEEERKKLLEQQKKLEQEYATTIASESVEFISLATVLGKTNAGSKERSDLITEINKKYGSTLKNLSDEALFQQQINDAVKDYIALETVRFKLAKNKEYEQKSIENLVDAENKLNKLRKDVNSNLQFSEDMRKAALGDRNAELRFINSRANALRDANIENDFQVKLLRAQQAEYQKLKKQYDDSNAALEKQATYRAELIKKEKEYVNDLFPNQDKETKNTNKTNDAVKSLTASQEFLLEIEKQKAKAITQTAIENAKKTATLIDDLNVEKQIEIDAITERRKAADDAIDKDIKNKKKATAEKQKVEAAFNQYVQEINNKYVGLLEAQNITEAKSRAALNAELIRQNNILQDEIVFGNESTTDTIKELRQRETQITIDALTRQIEAGNLSQKEYAEVLEMRNGLLIAQLKESSDIEQSIAKANRDKALNDYKLLLEGQLNIKLDYEQQKITIDEAIANLEKKKKAATTESEKGDIENQIQAYKNLKQTQINLEEQYNVEKRQINEKTNAAISDKEQEVLQKTFEQRLRILTDYFAIASDALSQFGSGSLGGFNGAISQSLSLVQNLLTLSEQSFETTADKITAYASVVGAAINSVLTAFIDQNESKLQQDLENFRLNTDEKKKALADQYNNGLITREAYDSAIKDLDNALEAQQLATKKDAFEQDKKLRIAQATIAGLQGAVAAFAGAMQLGPILGPIIGSVLAASVAALTAAQIAQIKKQKFDAGPGQIDTSSTTSAASTIVQSSTGGFTQFNENVTGGGTNTGLINTPGLAPSGMQKVYVLESDITAAQDRVRVLENNSTFG